MTGQARVAFLTPAGPGRLLREAAATLEERGCPVRCFETLTELEADQALLDQLEVLASPVEVPDAVVARAQRLRALISPWTGTEMFDTKAAQRRDIAIANGQIEQNYISMAEATVMLMLVTSYDLDNSRRLLNQPEPRRGLPTARMLMGRTIGLIGMGLIAQAVAKRLSAWDVRLLAYQRNDKPLPPGVTAVPLDTLLQESDIVSLHLPLTADTRHLIDERRLRLLKQDAVLINTARGGIVDEGGLVRVAGERPDLRFALDTFEVEPLPSDSPVRDIPKAVLTPHCAGHTSDTISRLPGALVANVLRFVG